MIAPTTEGTIVVIGDATELSGSLISALGLEGYRVRSMEISNATGPINSRRYGVDPNSEESVESFIEYLRSQDGQNSVSAIVSLIGVGMTPSVGGVTEQLFLLLRKLLHEYRPASEESTALLLNVIELDGRMGMTGEMDIDDDRIGTVGMCKAIEKESMFIHSVNLDIAPDLPTSAKLAAVLDLVLNPPQLTDVGVDSQGRWTVSLREADLSPQELSPEPVCGPDSVILVAGGGDGVTAYVLKQFAPASPTFVIIGRTPLADPQDQPYLYLDEKALRVRLIQETVQRPIDLSQIEKRVRQYRKQGRVQRNLDTLRELGAKVEYIAADVSNCDELGNLIDDVYHRYGRIDGVLHGAGIIKDRLLTDKTLDSFRLVYSTKVNCARTLAKKLRPEGLRFLVFFSSVAGRFGNHGQSDYGAANEYMNKLSNYLNKRWPGRVVSIQWGPWDGGMIDDVLKDAFERRGVRLIPMEGGAAKFADELRLKELPTGEVLISRSVERIATANPTRERHRSSRKEELVAAE